MTTPRPLFVLGKHRSGTTWLANQLCGHPSIAGVQHPDHFGIHESAYFERVAGRFGDLENRANYIEFVRVMTASDYFRLAGADDDFLYGLWPSTYPAVFRAVMDRFALAQGATWWLEKSPGHTPHVRELHTLYPDARFLGIIRDPVEVAASVVARSEAIPGARQDRRGRGLRIARVVTSWAHYNRAMVEFARSHPSAIRMTSYARLRSDTATVLREMCEFLEVPFDPEMTRTTFVRDTNIADDRHRRTILTDAERRLARRLASASGAVPSPLFTAADRTARSFLGRRELPTWFFRLLDEAPPEAPAIPVAPEHRAPSSEPAGV